MAEIVISDANYLQYIDPVVNGEVKRCGTRPRDLTRHPRGGLSFAKPFDLPLIPESEWQSRLDAQIAAKARLSDVRNRMGPGGGPIPSRDQNGRGYCWAHSGVSAALMVRAANNQPFVDLSAYMVACIIKGYADEGGWGLEGIEFQAENGCASSEFWPQQGVKRSYDTPEMRANARLHRITEWMELGSGGSMKAQLVTCLLQGIPVVVDYNWWSHSVCAIDLVKLQPFQIRIWNSWGDEWSENGTGILEGSKAIPDDAVAPRVLTAATV